MNNIIFTGKEDIMDKDVVLLDVENSAKDWEDIMQQAKYMERTVIPAYNEACNKIKEILDKEGSKNA